MNSWVYFALAGFLLSLQTSDAAFELPESAFRLEALSAAQQKARKEQKPITFLFSISSFFYSEAEDTDLFSSHPAGATNYAIHALSEKTVIVFVDAERERGRAPALVEEILYDAGFSFYTPPKVVVVDSELKHIISVVPMTTNVEERQKWFLEALERIEDPSRWENSSRAQVAPSKVTTSASEAVPLPIWVVQVASGLGGFTLGVLTMMIYSRRRSGENDF